MIGRRNIFEDSVVSDMSSVAPAELKTTTVGETFYLIPTNQKNKCFGAIHSQKLLFCDKIKMSN